MKKVNTTKVSGTQELLPEEQAIFDQLKTSISFVYHNHGFLGVETPHLERTDILLAKAGGDTEKQIYKVVKTTEAIDEPDEGLRFDHTVPLARYVVEHESQLTFPFKVKNIGINFRGERAQKGRFREFYQCDIDVIGRNNLPIAYDADVIATLLDAFSGFELNTPVLARINNRKILGGLLEAFNLEDKAKDISSIIDHSEKVPLEKTRANFEEIGLSNKDTEMLLDLIEINGDRASVIKKLSDLNITNSTFQAGLSELNEVMSLLEAQDLKNTISADLKIVRGLDYYTGTVFEFILPEHKDIGSVCGGGRYENLAMHFSDQSFPGVGGSIGLTRLFYVLNENKLLKKQVDSLLDYIIVPISEAEYDYSNTLANQIRHDGSTVTVLYSDKKLGDKLSYAAKLAKNAIVIGDEEVKTNQYKIKTFSSDKENNHE